MVRFVADRAIEEEAKHQTPLSKLKSSSELLLQDFNLGYLPDIPGIDDLSLPPVDSFSDFESIRDWIDEMQVPDTVGICLENEIPDGVVGLSEDAKCSEEKDGFTEVGTVDGHVAVAGGFNKKGLIEAEFDGVKLEKTESCKVEMEKCGGVADFSGLGIALAEKSKVREVDGGGGEIFESLGSLIEEGMEKVSLVCDSQSSVIQEDGVKRTMMVNDEDGNDSGLEAESESSSSASSSESPSSSENEDTGDDDGEKEDKKEMVEDKVLIKGQDMGEVHRYTAEGKEDMEEGEILETDADKMVDWSDNVHDDSDEEESRGLGAYEEYDCGDDDDDEGDGEIKGPIRSKNELEVLPPVPPVSISLKPFHQMLPVGVVSSIIGAQVIVEGMEKHNPLSEGSVLWITETRSALGIVDEIFGPVKNPYYMVRYNSESEVPSGIQQGTSISFVQEFVDHVLIDQNLYHKGYDASGENDEEVSYEVEFSDDEKEAEYKRMLKMTKRKKNNHQRPGNEEANRRNPPRTRNNRKSKNIEPSVPRAPTHAGPSLANQMQQQQQQHEIEGSASVHNWSGSGSGSGSGQVFSSGFVGPIQFPPLAQITDFPSQSQPHHMMQLQGHSVTGAVNHGNQFIPSGFGQVFPAATPFTGLGFPQLAQPGPAGAPWTRGIQYQPQNVVFGTPPWLQQNHLQAFSMPLANGGVPFQQRFPLTSDLPAGAGLLTNSPQLGVFSGIGLQGQLPQSLALGPSFDSSEPLAGPSFDSQSQPQPQPSFAQNGEANSYQYFNQGASSNRGGRQLHRRGGRFGPGRGRHQR
ncbi:hypothetical protein Dimus_029973 [Dionaea muscipula]